MSRRTDALDRELPPRWATTEQVLAHLGDIGRDTLRSLMADTERAGIQAPWIAYQQGGPPRYRWDCRALQSGKLVVDEWFERVAAWRVSIASQQAGRSDGETRTGPHAPEPSRPSRPRKPSGAKSKTPWVEVEGGSPLTLIPSR